jgi:hypothetical protein
MSAPPSWESRWPNRTYVGCGTNLLATKLSPWRKVVALLDEAVWDEGEGVAEVAQVGLGVHPHQQQVVALGKHFVMDLLGPLRRGQQVEPELAAFGGDQRCIVGGERRHCVGRLGGADVCEPRR